MKTVSICKNGTKIELEALNWWYISNSRQLMYICFPNECSNLISLKIRAPNIKLLSPFAFRAVINLQILHLNFEHLQNLPEMLFSSLVKLIELDLNFTILTELETDTFSKNINLQKLRIRSGTVSYNHKMFVNFFNLKELVLEHSQNLYVNITNDWFLFAYLNKLRTLKVQTSIIWEMSEIFNIKRLNLSFGRIFELEFFKNFDYLTHLNLSNCYEDLSCLQFNKRKTLKVLILKHNSLERLDMKFSKHLTNLTFFDLENCLLRNIKKIQLGQSCPNLTYFSLRHNLLCDQKLNQNLFTNSFQLLKLDLSFNYLKTINYSSIFSSLINLKILLLNNNELVSLPTACFWNLQNLQVLDLSVNYLTKFQLNWFDVSTQYNLEILNLESNRLSCFPKKCLKLFRRHLKHLNLADNLIAKLSKRNFRYGRKIKVLNLALNQLSVLKQTHFENLRQLKILNLRYNEIVVFERKTFENFTFEITG